MKKIVVTICLTLVYVSLVYGNENNLDGLKPWSLESLYSDSSTGVPSTSIDDSALDIVSTDSGSDVPGPSSDAPSPGTDIPESNSDAPSPSIDTSNPSIDMPDPVIDTSESYIVGTDSRSDVPGPSSDAPSPNTDAPDTPTPSNDATSSVIDTSGPIVVTPDPASDVPDPSTDLLSSGIVTPELTTNAPSPGTEAPSSSTDVSDSSTNVPIPGTIALGFSIDETSPATDAPLPVIDTSARISNASWPRNISVLLSGGSLKKGGPCVTWVGSIIRKLVPIGLVEMLKDVTDDVIRSYVLHKCYPNGSPTENEPKNIVLTFAPFEDIVS